MEPDFFGPLLGFGLLVLIVWAAVVVGLVVLYFWIVYTVVWRAVRRGMKEFHYPKGQ